MTTRTVMPEIPHTLSFVRKEMYIGVEMSLFKISLPWKQVTDYASYTFHDMPYTKINTAAKV